MEEYNFTKSSCNNLNYNTESSDESRDMENTMEDEMLKKYEKVLKSKSKKLKKLPLNVADVVRLRANRQERQRQGAINAYFDKLKRLNMPENPYVQGHKKDSKYYLLMTAVAYIRGLKMMLEEHDQLKGKSSPNFVASGAPQTPDVPKVISGHNPSTLSSLAPRGQHDPCGQLVPPCRLRDVTNLQKPHRYDSTPAQHRPGFCSSDQAYPMSTFENNMITQENRNSGTCRFNRSAQPIQSNAPWGQANLVTGHQLSGRLRTAHLSTALTSQDALSCTAISPMIGDKMATLPFHTDRLRSETAPAIVNHLQYDPSAHLLSAAIDTPNSSCRFANQCSSLYNTRGHRDYNFNYASDMTGVANFNIKWDEATTTSSSCMDIQSFYF